MKSPHAAEREFTSELNAQTAHYQQTLTVAERILEAICREQDITDALLELGQRMSVIGQFQERASRAETQWKALGREAGPTLREAFNSHQDTLRRLLDTVRDSEQRASAAKSELEPQMNAAARDRKVVQRYGDAAKL